MSESESYANAEFFRKPNLSEYLSNVPKCGLNTRHMIIVKWHSFDTNANFALWQMRHRLNPRKRVNEYQRYSMLTVLPLKSMSCTLGNSSSLQAAGDDHSCRYYNPLSAKNDIIFEKFFVYLMMTNVIVKTCLNQKIIKKSNLIQAMKNSVCPTANVIRRPIFSKSRIFRKQFSEQSTERWERYYYYHFEVGFAVL